MMIKLSKKEQTKSFDIKEKELVIKLIQNYSKSHLQICFFLLFVVGYLPLQ